MGEALGTTALEPLVPLTRVAALVALVLGGEPLVVLVL
jgi:hypothetical protein